MDGTEALLGQSYTANGKYHTTVYFSYIKTDILFNKRFFVQIWTEVQSETLPIVTREFTRELTIDSLRARIYWSTGHSVECARLNGMERMRYFQTGLYSEFHVMGLTIDVDMGHVYWLVRSNQKAVLYKANLMTDANINTISGTIETVGQLKETNVRGPLVYFNDRLFGSMRKITPSLPI